MVQTAGDNWRSIYAAGRSALKRVSLMSTVETGKFGYLWFCFKAHAWRRLQTGQFECSSSIEWKGTK